MIQAKKKKNNNAALEIAVIGMAGKFPAAANIDEFWNNLKNGVESITFLSDEELIVNGSDPALINQPDYIKSSGGVLEDRALFDASFFGYTPLEAEIMDPQIRLLHESAWEALENAGYVADTYEGLIGLYASAGSSFNWKARALLSERVSGPELFNLKQLVDREFLCLRVSYKLNLRGPSLVVQSTCSSSLAAVHMACRALLTAECDMALAAGVKGSVGDQFGYHYHEGYIYSADGHSRVFDAQAKGTTGGNGVGVLVLKRLKHAAADRDHIWATILGTAVNNDGSRKVGFNAPSVDGQVEVIKTALQITRVEPESIGYVETHGTGTVLGDPVELEALKQAFNTGKKSSCAVGSVKTNIGHLDAAAGIAGFIKTVLILQHKQIPPSLHFENPNPGIDFENSPFYVNTKLADWRNDEYPLRAGVSSFGIGGTNVHVLLEEPPPGEESSESRKWKMLFFSAKTATALEGITKNFAGYLQAKNGINLADAAYTLQVGRKTFAYRKMLVCGDAHEAIESLSSPGQAGLKGLLVKKEKKPVVFLFPGQGSQYVNMGLELYENEPVFREEMDRCFEILGELVDYDIKALLYPGEMHNRSSSYNRSYRSNRSYTTHKSHINQTEIAQPVLFIFEYSLAKLLMRWEINPDGMIGHSIGEYVAACLTGVFSLEDALKLVVTRGKLMQRMPPGGMLSLSISEEELAPLLTKRKNISLAAVNSSSHCVVSGPFEAIDDFEEQLKIEGYETSRLHTSHAFHSSMMEPILMDYKEACQQVEWAAPSLPYLSNVTGNWITAEEAGAPGYWVKHIRSTVRFSTGLEKLLKEEGTIFLEIGPGKALATFVRQHKDKRDDHSIINLIRHPKEDISDQYYLLNKIGQLWLYGKAINWDAFYSSERRQRIPLPTYPFERQRYWIDEDIKITPEILSKQSPVGKKTDMADWFYLPMWEQASPMSKSTMNLAGQSNWLVFVDECGIAGGLISDLEQMNHHVITVKAGDLFGISNDDAYMINPCQAEGYDTLFKELLKKNKVPQKILHFWSVTRDDDRELDFETLDRTQDLGLYSLQYLVQAIGRHGVTSEMEIVVVTNNLHEVTGEEYICPDKATILGAVKVIPLEYNTISCRNVDIVLPHGGSKQPDQLKTRLLEEFLSDSSEKIAAWRGKHRWVQTIKPYRLESAQSGKNSNRLPSLKEKGVYLIIGGFGGMGFTLAQHLATNFKAKLILVGRSDFPAKDEWHRWLTVHDENDQISAKIRRIQEWEENGAEIMVCNADVSDYQGMKEVINQSGQRFGQINGVIHTAGVIDYAGVIQRRTREMTWRMMASKVKGTLVLDTILKDTNLDMIILFSSIGNFIYGVKFGQVSYNAANEFLDAFAYYKNSRSDTFTATINWCDWKEVGMSVAAVKNNYPGNIDNNEYESLFYNALSPGQGIQVFERILESGLPRVVVSTVDLHLEMDKINNPVEKDLLSPGEADDEVESHEFLLQRPELSTPYAAAEDEIQQTLGAMFQKFLGIEKVGIYDDFFELGGDSLKALTIAAKINKKLNVRIPIAEFFNRPTIKNLAEYISNIERSEYSPINHIEEKEYYPLSPPQKGIYFLHHIEEANITYNQPLVFELENLDEGRLHDTLKKLIKRHESLRTSFEMIGEEPVQRIHDQVEIEYEYLGVYLENEVSTINAFIKRFTRPFNLSKVPLFRVGVVSSAENHYLLLVDIHHIISDGVSNNILASEFIAIYEGETLPQLRLRYRDFSQWRHIGLTGEKVKPQEKYWLKLFEGKIPVLDMQTDYPRSDRMSSAGDSVHFTVGKELNSRLKVLMKETGTTLYMVLLAAFNVLLSKHSGQEDIVVGSPITGRSNPDLQNIIGMFVNMLSMRNFPQKDKTFEDFLEDVKVNTLDAYENQDFQFEELIRRLGLQGNYSRNPLFDVVFQLSNVKRKTMKRGNDDAKLLPSELRAQNVPFDLIVEAEEIADEIYIKLAFVTALFKRNTAENLLKRYVEILEQAANNKKIKLRDVKVSHQRLAIKVDAALDEGSDFGF